MQFIIDPKGPGVACPGPFDLEPPFRRYSRMIPRMVRMWTKSVTKEP